MSTIPSTSPDEPYGQVPDGWLDNPAVRMAEQVLRWYGESIQYEPMTRERAEALLPFWVYYRELSPREVRAVYARFGGAK